jgi:hypothetical protein
MKHHNCFGEPIEVLTWSRGFVEADDDLMTLEDFEVSVDLGYLIDYDGHGAYSDGVRVSNASVFPSDIANGNFDRNFSHVVWYNK